MPSDLFSGTDWVTVAIQQWPVSHTLEGVPYAEFLSTLRSLPGGYHGVAVGRGRDSGALLFLSEGRMCGVTAGELRGRDALSYLARTCESMTWEFRQATECCVSVVPIMASTVGEGGRQLARRVEPIMSAHLQALADLERNTRMHLVVEPAGLPDTEWILFSNGRGHVHRIAVSAGSVELPAEKGLDAATLMAVFRKQKATDELYEVIPRFFSDEVLDSVAPSPPPLPAPAEQLPAVEATSSRRRSAGVVVYVLPVAFVVLLAGGWVLWPKAISKPPGRTSDQVKQVTTLVAASTASGSADVQQLQGEVAFLRSQLAALRTAQEPSAGAIEPGATRRASVRVDTAGERGRSRDLDSLVRRIGHLEQAIRRETERSLEQPRAAAQTPRADIPAAEPTATEATRPDTTPQQPEQPQLQASPPTLEHVVTSAPSSTAAVTQSVAQPEAAQPRAPAPVRAYAEALVDTRPVVLENPRPEYPRLLRRARFEGDILISILVGTDGLVQQAIPVRGPQELRQAAVDGVRKWRYQPALLDGTAVPCWTTTLITFRAP